jgi:hypothetical protein
MSDVRRRALASPGPAPGGLGHVPNPPDPRDFDLAGIVAEIRGTTELTLSGARRWHWEGQAPNDQGQEGACSSFGPANALNCLPRKRRIGNAYAMNVYRRVTENDSIPGDWRSGQEGSYPRDCAKRYQDLGKIRTYAFTRSVEVMVDFLLNEGPITFGSDWLHSMDHPDPEDDYYARVDYRRGVRGRHLYCLAGFEGTLGEPGAYFVILNSWGTRFAYEGRARLSEAGMRILLQNDRYAEAMTFVDAPFEKRVA